MRTIVLTFHDVAVPAERGSTGFQGVGADRYKLTPERFARHLEAAANRDGVVLTFDDGGVSASTTIAPLLEAAGYRGRFFVPTAHVGAPGFLDAPALRELRARGHAVGAHGHTHRPLPPLPDDELAEEWQRSRAILEEILGETIVTASVPRGYFDRRVAEAAARAGFTDLFTSEPWTTPRTIGALRVHGRFAVVDTTRSSHVGALCRRSRLAIGRDAAAWQARKLAKRFAGPLYERARTARLAR